MLNAAVDATQIVAFAGFGTLTIGNIQQFGPLDIAGFAAGDGIVVEGVSSLGQSFNAGTDQLVLTDQVNNHSTLQFTGSHVASDFSKQAHAAQKELEGEVAEMKKTLGEETKRMKDTFESMDVKVREDYQDLVKETRKKMEEELDNEVQSARDAVKAYRVERISLLNKEIVGLVEDTARLALRRSLSLDQHRDIIMAALEEAKQQGLFTKTA